MEVISRNLLAIACEPHAKRKLLLQGVHRVSALGGEPLHLRFVQGCCPLHKQVYVDGHNHARDRVCDLGVRCLNTKIQTRCTLHADKMHT